MSKKIISDLLVGLVAICAGLSVSVTAGEPTPLVASDEPIKAVLSAPVTQAYKDKMKEVCGKGVITTRFTHVYPDGPASYYTFLAPGKKGAQLDRPSSSAS